jgi:hypothetical protein
MPKASVRRDSTGNPDQLKGLPQLAGGMDRLCLPAGTSRRYGGVVNWPAG